MRKSGNLFNGIMPKIIVGLCALFFVGTANAVTLDPGVGITGSCTSVTCTSAIINSGTTEHWPEISSLDIACSGTIEERCYQNTTTGAYAYVRSCTACKDGFELTSTSYSASQVCSSRAPIYYGCQAACTGCDNCDEYVGEWAEYTPTGGMAATTAGYQYRDSQSCNMNTCACETTRSYRCAQGSYGYATTTSSGGPTGCTRCPTLGSILTGDFVWGTTDGAATASLITSCYIAAGSPFSDDTGSGIYPEDCPYETDPK